MIAVLQEATLAGPLEPARPVQQLVPSALPFLIAQLAFKTSTSQAPTNAQPTVLPLAMLRSAWSAYQAPLKLAKNAFQATTCSINLA